MKQHHYMIVDQEAAQSESEWGRVRPAALNFFYRLYEGLH